MRAWNTKCLTCENIASTRGLCRPCYETAKSLVSERKTTWLELENKGMASSPQLMNSKFYLKFKEMRERERDL